MIANQRKDLTRVRAVTGVNDDIEANAAEGSVGAQAMDADVKDVDVLCGEYSGELMQQAWLVVEPGTEREVTTG
jgi:hypothetical protein